MQMRGHALKAYAQTKVFTPPKNIATLRKREAAARGDAFTLKITPLTVLTNELKTSAHEKQMKWKKGLGGLGIKQGC